MIPILENHDPFKVIGCFVDGVFSLIDGQERTKSQIFDAFGNCGIEILRYIKKDKTIFIKKFRVHEWTLPRTYNAELKELSAQFKAIAKEDAETPEHVLREDKAALKQAGRIMDAAPLLYKYIIDALPCMEEIANDGACGAELAWDLHAHIHKIKETIS